MAEEDPVVFAAGEYEVACPRGSATVHVPRDIRLREASEALAPLMEHAARHGEREEEKEAA